MKFYSNIELFLSDKASFPNFGCRDYVIRMPLKNEKKNDDIVFSIDRLFNSFYFALYSFRTILDDFNFCHKFYLIRFIPLQLVQFLSELSRIWVDKDKRNGLVHLFDEMRISIALTIRNFKENKGMQFSIFLMNAQTVCGWMRPTCLARFGKRISSSWGRIGWLFCPNNIDLSILACLMITYY